jgi:hypothetical protein
VKIINPNLYPTGGYFFIETDGTRITGPNWSACEYNVKKYRQNRGLPVGDVHADVMAQACQRNASLCHDSNPVQVERPRGSKVKSEVFQWLSGKSRESKNHSLDYVSDKEATARAAICRTCPRQLKISHLCATCTESRRALRKSVLQDRTILAKDLEACAALAIDLPTAIYLAEPTVDDQNLPENCWRKRK